MTLLNPKITYFDSSYRPNIPTKLLHFLKSLNGLTVFDIKGEDQHRTRVVTTLIHGNEPSGLIATHLWLISEHKPATNIRIIICNPEAARTKPFFTNRYIEQSDDLNRFFSKEKENLSPVAERARQITQLVREVSPEAIVDLHNTSGASPAFAVSICDDFKHLKLVELFTANLIFTQLKVGAIMEQPFGSPIVTIECGGNNDNSSHQIASEGLHRFFSHQEIFDHRKPLVKVLKHPIRVELINDASVGFSNHRLTTTDITFRADIEELNQSTTPKDEFIGWCEANEPLMFEAIDDQGVNQIDNLFENRNGCLFTRRDMHLFMVTTVPEIATKDCLFYTTIN